jgi:putative Holliday junction resolvase
MNCLGIDYGTKNIGLAISSHGVIAPLPAIINNDQAFTRISAIIKEYNIDKIYVGISLGQMAKKILKFVVQLQNMIKLPVETVEESVSTIEATAIYANNRHPKKQYRRQIDSVSAAVILNRVIS